LGILSSRLKNVFKPQMFRSGLTIPALRVFFNPRNSFPDASPDPQKLKNRGQASKLSLFGGRWLGRD
jgi:hypothetical protein